MARIIISGAKTIAGARTIGGARTITGARTLISERAPTFVSAEVGNVMPSWVILTFSESILANNAKDGMTVTVGGSSVTIDAGWVWDGVVYLSLDVPIANGNTVTVAYSATTGNLTGSGSEAVAVATFTDQSVTNNMAATHATYYVATTGDDGAAGSIGAPWATFAHAVETVVAGDVVLIRAGTYSEALYLYYDGGGSAGNFVTYKAYPTETVTIDGTGITLTSSHGLVEAYGGSSSYVIFDGFHINDSGMMGVTLFGAHHISVRNCHTYNTQKSGIYVALGNNLSIAANEIELANVMVQGSEENLSLDSSYYCEIRNNEAHHGNADTMAGGEGINIKNGSHDVVVHHNSVHNNPKLAFGLDGWEGHTYNIWFYDNICYTCAWGYIVETESSGSSDHIYVYNNIAYNITYAGLALPNWGAAYPVSYTYFINNTIFNCGYGFWQVHSNVSNIVIRNNIFSNNDNDPQITIIGGDEAKFTITNNLFDTPNTTVGTSAVQGDPLFTSEVTPDFHIGVGSPAIAAGLLTNAPLDDYDGVARGVAIDIGAYEKV